MLQKVEKRHFLALCDLPKKFCLQFFHTSFSFLGLLLWKNRFPNLKCDVLGCFFWSGGTDEIFPFGKDLFRLCDTFYEQFVTMGSLLRFFEVPKMVCKFRHAKCEVPDWVNVCLSSLQCVIRLCYRTNLFDCQIFPKIGGYFYNCRCCILKEEELARHRSVF